MVLPSYSTSLFPPPPAYSTGTGSAVSNHWDPNFFLPPTIPLPQEIAPCLYRDCYQAVSHAPPAYSEFARNPYAPIQGAPPAYSEISSSLPSQAQIYPPPYAAISQQQRRSASEGLRSPSAIPSTNGLNSQNLPGEGQEISKQSAYGVPTPFNPSISQSANGMTQAGQNTGQTNNTEPRPNLPGQANQSLAPQNQIANGYPQQSQNLPRQPGQGTPASQPIPGNTQQGPPQVLGGPEQKPFPSSNGSQQQRPVGNPNSNPNQANASVPTPQAQQANGQITALPPQQPNGQIGQNQPPDSQNASLQQANGQNQEAKGLQASPENQTTAPQLPNGENQQAKAQQQLSSPENKNALPQQPDEANEETKDLQLPPKGQNAAAPQLPDKKNPQPKGQQSSAEANKKTPPKGDDAKTEETKSPADSDTKPDDSDGAKKDDESKGGQEKKIKPHGNDKLNKKVLADLDERIADSDSTVRRAAAAKMVNLLQDEVGKQADDPQLQPAIDKLLADALNHDNDRIVRTAGELCLQVGVDPKYSRKVENALEHIEHAQSHSLAGEDQAVRDILREHSQQLRDPDSPPSPSIVSKISNSFQLPFQRSR
jgi:hypothetical protein